MQAFCPVPWKKLGSYSGTNRGTYCTQASLEAKSSTCSPVETVQIPSIIRRFVPAVAPNMAKELSLGRSLRVTYPPTCLSGIATGVAVPLATALAFCPATRTSAELQSSAARSEEHTSELQSRSDLVC